MNSHDKRRRQIKWILLGTLTVWVLFWIGQAVVAGASKADPFVKTASSFENEMLQFDEFALFSHPFYEHDTVFYQAAGDLFHQRPDCKNRILTQTVYQATLEAALANNASLHPCPACYG